MIGRTPTLPSFLTWLDQAAARQPDLARLRQVFQRQTPTWGQNAFETVLWEKNEGAAIRAKAAYPWMLPVLAKAEAALGVKLLRPALGRGANGQVFAVDGEPNRVVKITAEINEVRGLLRFQEHAADGAVTVHAVVPLGPVSREPDFPQDPREGWAVLRDAVTPLPDDEIRRLRTTWTGRPVDRTTVAPYLPAFSLQPLLDYDQERNLRMWMPRDEDELRPPWEWANDAGFAVNHFLHQGDPDRAQRAWAEYRAWISWIWALGKETLRPRLFSYLEDASGDDGVFFDFGPHNLGRRPDGQLVWYDLHYTALSEPVPNVDAVRRALAMSPYAPARPAHGSASGRDVEAPPARPGPMVIDVTQGAFLPGLLGEAAIYAAATAFAAQSPPDRWSSMLVHTEEGDLGPFRVYPDTAYPKKGTLSVLIVRRLGDTENYRWSAKRAGFVGGQEVGEIRRAPFKGSPLDTEAEARQLRRLQRRTGTAKTPADEALNASRVVILRLGLGRDSFTMLALLQEHKLLVQGKEIGPEEIDGVVFTDPGWEWAHSYEAIDDARRVCSAMGVPLYVQEKPPAEGPKGWIQWSKDWRAVHDAGEKMGRVRPWQADAAPLPLRSVRNTRPLTPTEQGAIQARCISGYYHDRPPILEDYQLRERIIQKKDASCTTNHKVVPSRALIADIAWIRFGVKDNVKKWAGSIDCVPEQDTLFWGRGQPPRRINMRSTLAIALFALSACVREIEPSQDTNAPEGGVLRLTCDDFGSPTDYASHDAVYMEATFLADVPIYWAECRVDHGNGPEDCLAWSTPGMGVSIREQCPVEAPTDIHVVYWAD